jgi:hypothetical protein
MFLLERKKTEKKLVRNLKKQRGSLGNQYQTGKGQGNLHKWCSFYFLCFTFFLLLMFYCFGQQKSIAERRISRSYQRGKAGIGRGT